MAIRLSQVLPWGRSFDEYRRMFDLSDDDLARRILGCGDGPASFNAEATALGHHVVSCDPIYVFDAAQICRRIDECYEELMNQVRREPSGFVWTEFRDPDDVGRRRRASMQRFLDDFENGKHNGRYVAAALPSLPFADESFDLALVSHLLFLYSDHLDLEFHWSSLLDLLRVAREARVFPLLNLNHATSAHLDPLLERCQAREISAKVQTVPYEFQRGANQMLVVRALPT